MCLLDMKNFCLCIYIYILLICICIKYDNYMQLKQMHTLLHLYCFMYSFKTNMLFHTILESQRYLKMD